jgi:hypothetical protein
VQQSRDSEIEAIIVFVYTLTSAYFLVKLRVLDHFIECKRLGSKFLL